MSKVIVITGASSGIGRALALSYARQGSALLLIGRNNDALHCTQSKARAYGADVYTLSQDLTDTDACDKIDAFLNSQNLKVHMLINNAGIGFHGYFGEMHEKDIDAVLTTNIFALVNLTHRLLPSLIETKGHIVNISSVYAHTPVIKQIVYAASKAFVESFSLGLAEELKAKGVTVSCVFPGSTLTSFRHRLGLKETSTRFSQAPDEVANYIMKGVSKNHLLIIPGWHNRLFMRVTHHLPKRWLVRIIPFIVYRLRRLKAH